MPNSETAFNYLITIEPLGLLYGSAGAFLSPENLVGRSGTKFPPSAVTLAGLFAASYAEQQTGDISALQLAGPFWSFIDNPQNFYVPTPFHLLTKLEPRPESNLILQTGTVLQKLTWQPQGSPESGDHYSRWVNEKGESPTGKFSKGTWLPIHEWQTPKTVYANPWEFLPHLHPRLQENQRHVVDPSSDRGSLYLENAVQMHPDTCLVYLSNTEIKSGWYRFGGEGHLAAVKSHPLDHQTKILLNTPLGCIFALITPAVWGSNRLSIRYPLIWQENIRAMLTERPSPFRYRLGGKDRTKRLSRGRYAVPAGTVYITQKAQTPWYQWQGGKDGIFPQDGDNLDLKKWGFGLALPI